MIQTVKIGTLKWHYIQDPSDEDLDFLKHNFHFHPLDIEDCKSLNQRPKIDIYDDYYFLILHFPSYDHWNRFLKTNEIKIFWGEDYVITIGKAQWVVSSLFESSLNSNDPYEILEAGTTDALLYKILEKLILESMSLIIKLGEELERINLELFNKKAEKTIERISQVRRNIILLDTILKPQLRLFQRLESGQIKGFADNMEEYWGNILDYYQKLWDLVEDYGELVEGLSKTFDSLQANRTNEIMKTLTLISSILLPMTFISGLFGMSTDIPFDRYFQVYWIPLLLMAVSSLLFIFVFKRKRWL